MPHISFRLIAAMLVFAPLPSLAAVNMAAKPELMPPAERVWSAQDYETALDLLRRAAPESLPRIGTHAPVMERIVNPDNLAPLQDSATPLDQRLRAGAGLVQSTTEILRLYLGALSKDPGRNDDIIWLEAFMLEEADILVGLSEENLSHIDPQSGVYAVRRNGVDDMKKGLVQVLSGCIMSLQAKSPASEETRSHMAQVLKAEWPRIAALLPAAARGEMTGVLKRLVENEPDPAVKAAFADIAVR